MKEPQNASLSSTHPTRRDTNVVVLLPRNCFTQWMFPSSKIFLISATLGFRRRIIIMNHKIRIGHP